MAPTYNLGINNWHVKDIITSKGVCGIITVWTYKGIRRIRLLLASEKSVFRSWQHIRIGGGGWRSKKALPLQSYFVVVDSVSCWKEPYNSKSLEARVALCDNISFHERQQVSRDLSSTCCGLSESVTRQNVIKCVREFNKG